MDNRATMDTRHKVKKNKKTKTQYRKLETWATRTPQINREWTQVLAKG